jgi:hypothetical protein
MLGIINSVLSAVKAELHEMNIRNLVSQAYSKDVVVRTLARAKLLEKDPQIFSLLEKVE